MKRITNRSGQTLLIAVLIVIVLLLSIPVVVLLSQIGSRHQIASQKRMKGRAIAEEGIAYATQVLSASQLTWNNALLAGTFPNPPCNSGINIPSASGEGEFRLDCNHVSSGLHTIQSYQVNVIA